jgi:hypothetical protein
MIFRLWHNLAVRWIHTLHKAETWNTDRNRGEQSRMTETRSERAESPFLPATASHEGLGGFPLGSVQSRAAARSLIAARRQREQESLRFQAVSLLDGKPLYLDGLAERMRHAWLRREAGEPPAAFPETQTATQSGDSDPLTIRMDRARARLANHESEEMAGGTL